MASIETIRSDFEFLDDWEDRYKYIIDLGKELTPLSASEKVDANKVQGCVSQVWLATEMQSGADPVISFRGDSDALIVRGLVALVLSIYNGKRRSEISSIDALKFLTELGLDQHLSPQRSNGLKAMIGRIRSEATSPITG